jgi:hypothetical protein
MADRYWVGGSANWDATAGTKWALTSGGTGGQANPTTSDDVYFDANSGGVTVTLTTTGNTRNLDFTGFTGTFAGSNPMIINGNLTLGSGWTRTHTGNLNFQGTTTGRTISSGDIVLGNNLIFNGAGGSWTITTDLTTTGAATTLTLGSLTLSNGITLTTPTFASSNTNTRTLNAGTAKIVFTGVGNIWNVSTSTGLTLNVSNSVFESNNTSSSNVVFNGAASPNFQYGTVFFNRGSSIGALTINGTQTFGLIKDRGTSAHNLIMGGGTTNTVSNFDVRGSSSSARVFLTRSSAATTALVQSPEGLIACDFINVGAVNVTPANTWYAGSGSISTSPGTGWVLATDPPPRELGSAGAG